MVGAGTAEMEHVDPDWDCRHKRYNYVQYCPMKDVLRTLLLEWEERELPTVIPRDYQLEEYLGTALNKALVVTGFRRVGKTYLLFGLIKKLLKTHPKKEVVYINFEDERIPTETETLSNLLPVIQETWGQGPKYLFLDELQNIPDWSKWLRRIIDTEEIKVVVTGSSSKMSSFEIPTELRGRSFEIQVFPLSFKEFPRFKNEALNFNKVGHLPSEKAKLHFLFDEYLIFGGLPEVVLTEDKGKKRELLQNYFQTVVRKEIVERFNVRNQEGLGVLLRLLLNSTHLTVSKLHNNLKSLDHKIGKSTLNKYLSHIESSYFLKPLFYYTPSLKNRLQYPRKPYFIDNGFVSSLSTKFSKNYGRLFENFAFWQLYKKYRKDIFYHTNRFNQEVDFVVFENDRLSTLMQVSWDLDDFETRKREERSLLSLGKKLNCSQLLIITKEKTPSSDPKIEILGIKEFFDFMKA